jgi:hypothetical protein
MAGEAPVRPTGSHFPGFALSKVVLSRTFVLFWSYARDRDDAYAAEMPGKIHDAETRGRVHAPDHGRRVGFSCQRTSLTIWYSMCAFGYSCDRLVLVNPFALRIFHSVLYILQQLST